MKKINLVFVCLILVIASLLSGCTQISGLQVKLGLKNNDFEYMKQKQIKKIVIQNTRDKGYKFILTNPVAISDIYDILSGAKVVDSKSSFKPDYVFDIYENDKIVHEFSYVVGLDKNDGGNLYSKNKNYIVTNRIDSEILNQFNDVRTPKDFNKVYYPSISECIDKYRASVKNNKSIGIDINSDLSVAKYIFSSDLDDFEKTLPSNVSVLNSADDPCDVKETVTTEGYKEGTFKYESSKPYTNSYIFKSMIVFEDNATKEEKKYYVVGINSNDYWKITISETKSADF
ncbi:hypothetical protein [Clostridium akagii]|uniref:hypothetical protein n=1 Tax=Clostridium akagii TaxID=91623 RepID=UPI0006897FBE|nr:hypothetical protein [Clostridium akagii]